MDDTEALRQENERLREGLKALELRIDADKALETQLRQEKREDEERLQQVEAEKSELKVAMEKMRSQLSQLSQVPAANPTLGLDLPEASDLLNQLKAKNRKSKVTLSDCEAILELLESDIIRVMPHSGG